MSQSSGIVVIQKLLQVFIPFCLGAIFDTESLNNRPRNIFFLPDFQI